MNHNEQMSQPFSVGFFVPFLIILKTYVLRMIVDIQPLLCYAVFINKIGFMGG